MERSEPALDAEPGDTVVIPGTLNLGLQSDAPDVRVTTRLRSAAFHARVQIRLQAATAALETIADELAAIELPPDSLEKVVIDEIAIRRIDEAVKPCASKLSLPKLMTPLANSQACSSPSYAASNR